MIIGRYFHTVRHLRPAQVFGRAWFRLQRPRPDLRAAPPLAPVTGQWTRWAWREPSMLGPSRFRFLGAEHDVVGAAGWDDARIPRLWRYNLHYFDDLVAIDAASRSAMHRALIARWITENGAGTATAWEPYPVSLRVVNWVKAELDARYDGRAGDLLDASAVASLAVQLRWLGRRLETHLMGNHLWANAKALVVGGLFFEGDEGAAWLARGSAMFRYELREQVLADGGHFELSPMYHATMLEDVLDLLNLARTFPARFPTALASALREVAPRMLHWLRVMTHPDGRIAFFNDAAFGIAPEFAQLRAHAHALGVTHDAAGARALAPCEVLADSGYVRLETTRAVVLCDIGAVGPDHLPAHAHADTLSFELSVDGERVLVNGGTSTYERDAERMSQRGTAAHNTVVVDDEDSSEVWGAFRVARRARARMLGAGTVDGSWAEGEHDGYRRLAGRVTHRRRWELRDDALIVLDTLEGTYREARAQFLFAPGKWAQVTTTPPHDVTPVAAEWHPCFGTAVAAQRLSLPVRGSALRTRISW